MMKIYVSDDVSNTGVELLRQQNYDVDVRPNLNEDDLCACIGEYDALVTRSLTHVTRRVIEAGTKLKVVGRAGVGVDSIDIKAATERGIIVVNTPEANTIAATEQTVALIMGVTRHIPQAHASIMAGKWDRKSFTGIQLQNRTIGILGVGRIGSRVAKRMQAMEMRTIGYDPYITEERFTQLGVERIEKLEDLLEQCDYVTLHVPLTDETRNMIKAEQIARMKDGAYLINCSRGAVVDIQALAAALKNGKLAGAALDVYPKEPLKPEENPFLGMTNVVLTPHLGASTKEAQIGVSIDVAHGVIAALNGEPVATAVNMAPISKNEYSLIHPYFELMEKMGTISVYLADGPIKAISVAYTGKLAETDTKILTTSVLKGALNPILQETVNFVNAAQVAKSRHIAVQEIKSQDTGYFLDAVTVDIQTSKGTHRIVGTLFNGTEAKIVQIDEHRVDFTPEGYLLLAPHIDQPNMIGQISTVLGQAGINISGMQVGKTTQENTNIMAIAVQDDIPNDIMLKLKGIDGILDMKLINCG